MSNNEWLHYKPGLTMDEPVTVTMAAADWAVFMSWVSHSDTDGVNHIVYGVIGAQISEALYTAASLKAAKAVYAQHMEQQPGVQILGQLFGQTPFPQPDDFREDNEE